MELIVGFNGTDVLKILGLTLSHFGLQCDLILQMNLNKNPKIVIRYWKTTVNQMTK